MRHVFPGSLRLRLVLMSTVVSVVVLVVVLAGLYLALATQLRAAVDATLGARLDDLAVAVGNGDVTVVEGDSYAQVIDAAGHVIRRSAAAPPVPVADPAQLRVSARSRNQIVTESLPGMPGLALVRVRAVGTSGELVVAATPLEAVEAARTRTLVVMAAALPVLLLALAIGVGVVVSAAMRPVRALTREAEAISHTDLGRRLPQAPGHDEIAELSRTLDAMLQRLATSVQRERAFVDDASHELRTPLTVLMGELELALSADSPEEARQGLRAALTESRRLSALAQDLLVLAREGASRPAADEVVNLVAVVAGAVQRLRPSVAGRVSLDVLGHPFPDAAAGAPGEGAAVFVVGRRDRLERVVLNLVGNAVEAGAERVVILVRRAGGQARLEVHDDGPGFPAALLPHAFERFRRGDAARTRSGNAGSGLGLAIVAATVRAHGGDVTAGNDSLLGGARIVVRLPVAPASRPPG